MDKRKLFLYVSSGIVWVLIVLCTLSQDHKNYSLSDYYSEPEAKEIALNESASMMYGPLSTGDTQVTLKYGQREISTTISEETENITCRSVFPANEKHVGIAFQNKNNLDTVVLFNEKEPQVFYNVIAMDADTEMIASLQPSDPDTLNLVITTFTNKVIATVELKNHTSSFLENPQIESAIFIKSEFKLDTVFGSYSVSLSSLI